jgi:hypothetical protein
VEREHTFATGRRLTGFMFGQDALVARLYDKTAEIAQRGFMGLHDLWGQRDREAPVWRLEFQYRRPVLVEFGLRSGGEVVAGVQDLWPYGAEEWLTLRTPTTDPRPHRWPIDPTWREVAAVQVAPEVCGVVRRRLVEATEARIVSGLQGYLSSWAALRESPHLRPTLPPGRATAPGRAGVARPRPDLRGRCGAAAGRPGGPPLLRRGARQGEGAEAAALLAAPHDGQSHAPPAGVAEVWVAARLGHANETLVLRTYGHLIPGQDQDAAHRLADTLRPPAVHQIARNRHLAYDSPMPDGPFTQAIRGLSRRKTYFQMQQGCDSARSTSWFNNVVHGHRVSPPSGPDLPRLATLLGTTTGGVAAMIAEEWYGVKVEAPSERARRLAPALNALSEGDARLVEALVTRLAPQGDGMTWRREGPPPSRVRPPRPVPAGS